MSGQQTQPESRILLAASHDAALVEDTPLPDFENDLAEHRLQVEFDALKHQVQASVDTHKLRLSYARRLFWLVCSWLACVVIAVCFSGFHVWGFSLSDAVLIAFITTTTINIVGLFFVVAKWLFPSNASTTQEGA